MTGGGRFSEEEARLTKRLAITRLEGVLDWGRGTDFIGTGNGSRLV